MQCIAQRYVKRNKQQNFTQKMYFTACPNAKELINKQKPPTFILVKQAKLSAYKPHVDGIAQYQQHISQSQSNYRRKPNYLLQERKKHTAFNHHC